jgi:hypothetical protein
MPEYLKSLDWSQLYSPANQPVQNWAVITSNDRPAVLELIGKVTSLELHTISTPAGGPNPIRKLKAVVEIGNPQLSNYIDDWFYCSITNIQDYLGTESSDTLRLSWDLNPKLYDPTVSFSSSQIACFSIINP